jgi:hypothetical protein
MNNSERFGYFRQKKNIIFMQCVQKENKFPKHENFLKNIIVYLHT